MSQRFDFAIVPEPYFKYWTLISIIKFSYCMLEDTMILTK